MLILGVSSTDNIFYIQVANTVILFALFTGAMHWFTCTPGCCCLAIVTLCTHIVSCTRHTTRHQTGTSCQSKMANKFHIINPTKWIKNLNLIAKITSTKSHLVYPIEINSIQAIITHVILLMSEKCKKIERNYYFKEFCDLRVV